MKYVQRFSFTNFLDDKTSNSEVTLLDTSSKLDTIFDNS